MVFAGGFLQNLGVLFDVVEAFADLDQPDVLVALDRGAVNRRPAALAVVALAVPAAEGEGDLFLRLGKEALEVLSGDRGVVILKEEVVSQFVCVRHGFYLRFVCFVFPFGMYIYHSKRG